MSDGLKAKLQKRYTDITSDIANEFYPKGEHRRGEFLRDQVVIFAKFVPQIDQALREEGYGELSPLAQFKRDKAMSPNYFLKRFREELDAEKQFIPAGMYKLMLEIAKRSAGVK
jgi:hypothetical protein